MHQEGAGRGTLTGLRPWVIRDCSPNLNRQSTTGPYRWRYNLSWFDTIVISSILGSLWSVGMSITTAFLQAGFPAGFLLLLALTVTLGTLILFYLFTLRH